jgi:Aspartyl protease
LNKNFPAERIVLPSLELGPLRTESLPVLIQDLSPLEEALGVRIDALIGFDVLSLGSFRIDYRSRRILYGPLETSGSSVPFETGPPLVTVRIEIGNQPVKLLVDTGASALMLFESRTRGQLRGLPIRSVRTSSNLAGEFQRKEVLLEGVRLGATKFPLQKGFLVGDQEDGGRSFDGFIGNLFVRPETSCIRFRAPHFQLEEIGKSERKPKPLPFGASCSAHPSPKLVYSTTPWAPCSNFSHSRIW